MAMSVQDVVAACGSRLIFHVDDRASATRFVFDLGGKFKLSNVRKLLDARTEGLDTTIVVVRDMPTSAALKSIHESGAEVEFFDVRELQYNITRHELVPLHEPIRDEPDIELVLRTHALKSRFHLPLIMAHDPVARYLALKHGQLVRITRRSSSAGQYVLYRCCVRSGH